MEEHQAENQRNGMEMSQMKQDRKVCPKGHQLILVPGTCHRDCSNAQCDNSWTCDMCKEMKEGGVTWRCGEDRRWRNGGKCDYDVGPDCLVPLDIGEQVRGW